MEKMTNRLKATILASAGLLLALGAYAVRVPPMEYVLIPVDGGAAAMAGFGQYPGETLHRRTTGPDTEEIVFAGLRFVRESGGQPSLLVLSGKVTSESDGRPLAGVLIAVPGTGQSTETDSDGEYRLEWEHNVYHPPAPVHAILPGHFPEERLQRLGCHWIVTLAGERPRCRVSLDFWMRPMDLTPGAASYCPVEGTIYRTPGDQPILGVVVVDGLDLRSVADSRGRYRIEEVPAGLQTLRVRGVGMADARRTLWVSCDPKDEPLELGFRLASLVVVE